MSKRIAWPERYKWLHEYLSAKPDAVFEYQATWDANLYRLNGKIFALLLRSKDLGTLLNLKCEPYLALDYRSRYETVIPGWHMNKLHWISLVLRKQTPEDICRELVDLSYDLVWESLPVKIRKVVGSRITGE